MQVPATTDPPRLPGRYAETRGYAPDATSRRTHREIDPGDAVITGNVKGGAIEDGVLSGGTANNVYLRENRKITVAGALTGSIGVTMQKPGFAPLCAPWDSGK